MFTTVAALVIVLGLMVALARSVRRHSAERQTQDLLVKLDLLISEYQDNNRRALPAVHPFPPPVESPESPEAAEPSAAGADARRLEQRLPAVAPLAAVPSAAEDALPEESALQKAAKLNNRDLLMALRREASRLKAPTRGGGLSPGGGDKGGRGHRFAQRFGDLPLSMYDEITLRDAWGTPVVFMPAMHPAVGMAHENKPFFVSAGPDRKFSTPADNLYSYEVK